METKKYLSSVYTSEYAKMELKEMQINRENQKLENKIAFDKYMLNFIKEPLLKKSKLSKIIRGVQPNNKI